MFIFLLLLLVMVMWKTKYIGKYQYIDSPISQRHVLALRGVLAIEIVLGHTYGRFPSTEILIFNDRIGVWPVGLFLFLSGYGLMSSLHHKHNYLKGFLVKRVWGIFFPFLLVWLVDILIEMNIQKLNFSYFLTYFMEDWFVVEILILYVVWYVAYRFWNERKAFCFLFVITIILNIFGCIYAIGSRWYGSTMCFLFGILYEKNESSINAVFKEKYLKYWIIHLMFFMCLVGLFALYGANRAIGAIAINGTCLLLCDIVYLLLMKFNLSNPVTELLGSISWEIYVVHRMVIHYFKYIDLPNIFIRMCLLLVSIVIVAWCLHKICKQMTWKRRVN